MLKKPIALTYFDLVSDPWGYEGRDI